MRALSGLLVLTLALVTPPRGWSQKAPLPLPRCKPAPLDEPSSTPTLRYRSSLSYRATLSFFRHRLAREIKKGLVEERELLALPKVRAVRFQNLGNGPWVGVNVSEYKEAVFIVVVLPPGS